jgi:hypothetical protein
MLRTGALSVAPLSFGRCSQPPPVTQAFHSPYVTSWLPSPKGRPMATRWAGISVASPRLCPMVRLPAGSFTICGQTSQSRNVSNADLGIGTIAAGVGAVGLGGGGA